jgi:hypothetical protein
MMPSAEGLEGMLEKIGAAKEPAAPVLAAMQDELFGGSVEKILPALLKAAVAATPENRPDFLNSAQDLVFRYSRYGDEVRLPDMSDALREPLLALLANTEAIPAARRGQYGTRTVGDSAAVLDMQLHDAKSFNKATDLHTLTGEPVMDFVRQRSIARLKKETLPEWPSGANVKPERLKEIVASLAGKSPAEIIAAMQPLTTEERAAFVKWAKDPEDPPLPDSLKAMRGVIHSISPVSAFGAASFGSKTAELAPVIGFTPGTAMSAEFFAERAKALLTKAKESPPLVTFASIPGKLTLGWDFVAAQADPAAKASEGNNMQETAEGKVALPDFQHYFSHAVSALATDDKTAAVATLWVYAGNQQTLTHWLLQPDGTITTTGDEDVEEGKPATETLTKLLAAEKLPSRATIIFTVITREHAKVFEEKPRY